MGFNRFGGRETQSDRFLRRMNEASMRAATEPSTVAEDQRVADSVAPTISAVSASATSGTWAGCTTLSYMSKDRCIASTITASSPSDFFSLHRKFHSATVPRRVATARLAAGQDAGDRWQKFANLRSYLTFMYTIPGKSSCLWAANSLRSVNGTTIIGLDWQLLTIRCTRRAAPLEH